MRFVRWKAKELRHKRSIKIGRDVTLEEVSQSTGIGMTTLSNLENNKVEGTDFSTVERLAAFYEVENLCDLLELSAEPRQGKRAPGLPGAVATSA
jgi:DNA-binding Xre family transcriptional regulator